ncbi:kanadaptin-like [Amphiura filiformis]|uniref:kanadaptin-like n=1 Tax=Amphiura filiformis TaxID=82378 RepID=UPI003B228598
MAANTDIGISEELTPQSESSAEKNDRSVDPKMASIENNVVGTSSAAQCNKVQTNPSKSDMSTSKAVKAKEEVGFKLPQLPLIGKLPRPKHGTGSKFAEPETTTLTASLCQQKTTDVKNSGKLTMGSKSTISADSKDSGGSPTKEEVNKVTGDKASESDQKQTTVTTEEFDTFAAPKLPNKQPKLQSVKPEKAVDVSSSSEEEKQIRKVSSETECLSSSENVTSTNLGEKLIAKEKSKSISKLSPAEKLARTAPLPYKEPSWSGVPRLPYNLEVLKGGTILSKIPLNEKPYVVFGRLESCDVMLEHPSLSRYHMILQYRSVGDSDNDPGFYVFDLDSTHGSFLNKQKVKPKTYCRMHVGHMFKLAGSTRLYILQGPAEDEEAESELSVTELKQMREKQLIELEKQKIQETKEEEEKQRQEEEEKGISWGMDDDDVEEEDPSEENPFALMSQEEREALYIKDPKKTLRGFFEREGFELEYDVEEKDTGHGRQYICRVELPVDDAEGYPITAEAAVSGKKKEAVVACALEACRILDAQGVLRQAKHESKKKKAKNWAEDDYYDSDDDTFLDRTGEIEKKRAARMKKAGVIKEQVETFASLTAKLAQVESEMKQIDEDIESLKQTSEQASGDDSLEAFMSSIKSGTAMDKSKRAKLKIHKIELRKEQAKLLKLINIARPAALPQIKRQAGPSKEASSSSSVTTKKLPMFGSLKGRLGAKKFKFVMPVAANPVAQPAISSTTDDIEEEEEEEEEEDDDKDVPMETSKGEQKEPEKSVKDLRSKYGQKTVTLVRDLERVEQKIARHRNHLRYSLRCKELELSPPSLMIKCPINTKKARDIIAKAQ